MVSRQRRPRPLVHVQEMREEIRHLSSVHRPVSAMQGAGGMICRHCGKDGKYWNDTIDPDREEKHLFYLCEECQRKLFSLVKGFLEGRE